MSIKILRYIAVVVFSCQHSAHVVVVIMDVKSTPLDGSHLKIQCCIQTVAMVRECRVWDMTSEVGIFAIHRNRPGIFYLGFSNFEDFLEFFIFCM